jgi:adenine phosphoribosyltransferase
MPQSSSDNGVNLRAFVRDIPDFPKPGVVFRDITPLLLDPRATSRSTSSLPPRRAASFSAERSLASCTPGSCLRAKSGSCRT